jgi:FRG domain-containing protein
MNPLQSLAEVRQHLSSLALPADGFVRVFRGQTRNYQNMLSSAYRSQVRRSRNWSVAVADRIFSDIEFGQAVDCWSPDNSVWVSAILQHYRSGTIYLDVTRSLEVALWFALHQPKSHTWRAAVKWPKGMPIEACFCTYRKSGADCGWLYVFDVSIATASRSAVEELVDVSAHAPPAFATSARIQKQQACLIGFLDGTDHPDLSYLFACDPIAVSWPMSDSTLVNEPTDYLFPGPSDDHWYARLLHFSFNCQLDEERALAIARHPLEITYFCTAPQDILDYIGTFRPYGPTHLGAFLAEYEDKDGADDGALRRVRNELRDATRVILEAPIQRSLPPIEMWNEGLLAEDVPFSVPIRSCTGDHLADEIQVRSVFIEFAPLEYANWAGQMRTELDDAIIRGAHLNRIDRYRYRFVLYMQHGTTGAIMPLVPLAIYFCGRDARFRCSASGLGIEAELLADEPAIAKPFFTCLQLLRDLSPTSKPAPFAAASGLRSDRRFVT